MSGWPSQVWKPAVKISGILYWTVTGGLIYVSFLGALGLWERGSGGSRKWERERGKWGENKVEISLPTQGGRISWFSDINGPSHQTAGHKCLCYDKGTGSGLSERLMPLYTESLGISCSSWNSCLSSSPLCSPRWLLPIHPDALCIIQPGSPEQGRPHRVWDKCLN